MGHPGYVFDGSDSDRPRGVQRFVCVAVGCLLVGGLIVGAMVGLVTDEDKWGWGLVLLAGVLAAFALVRNLLGRTPSPSEEPGPVRWWHKALALAALFLAFMVKGLSALGLSVVAAIVNAAIAMSVLAVVGGAMFLYERHHAE